MSHGSVYIYLLHTLCAHKLLDNAGEDLTTAFHVCETEVTKENSIEHFAARALSIKTPEIFHVVEGAAAAARHNRRDGIPQSYDVYANGSGSFSIHIFTSPQFRDIDPLSRVGIDPFSQRVGMSSGESNMAGAIQQIQGEDKIGWPTLEHDLEEVQPLGEAYRDIVLNRGSPPHVITHLKLYTTAAPTQYYGTTRSGSPVYIRYRGGRFRIDIGGARGSDGETVHAEGRGDTLDGVLSTEELANVLTDGTDKVSLASDLSDVRCPTDERADPEEAALQKAGRFSGRARTAAEQLVDSAVEFENAAEEVSDAIDSKSIDEDDVLSQLWLFEKGVVARVGSHLDTLYMSPNRAAVVNDFGQQIRRMYGNLEDVYETAKENGFEPLLSELYEALAELRQAGDDLHALMV